MATQKEIGKILATLHLDASIEVVEGLREVFFKSNIKDKEEIMQILRGAKKKVVVLAQGSGKKVHVDILKTVGSYINAHDRETFKEIDRIAFKFKEYLLANKIPTHKIDELISKVYLAIREKNNELNTKISDFTAEDLEQLMASACVYNSINKYIKQEKGEERVADFIFVKKIIPSLLNNQSNKFDMAVASNVEGLLAELTTIQEGMNPEEVFSEEDLESLIYKTTSVLFSSSAEKVKKVREVLGEFAFVVQEQAKQAGEDEEIINSLTVKSILLKCGAILGLGEKTLTESVGLLSGKPFSLIIDHKSASGGYKIASEYLPALKIDGLTVKKQIYFLTGRPSMLKDLGVKSVLEGLENLIDCALVANGEDVSAMKMQDKISAVRKLGIEPSKLLHADNLVDVFANKYLRDSNLKGNCAENFKYISSVINENMALSLLRHNVGFLCLDSTAVKDKIDEIVKNANGDAYKIEVGLEELFNATYSHNKPKQGPTKTKDKSMVLPLSDSVSSDEEKEKIAVVLTNGMFGAEKSHKRVKPEITAENYFDRLDVELNSINEYLFARMTKTDSHIGADTIGSILIQMSRVSSISQLQKGQIASKMEDFAKMLEFALAEKDEDKYEYIQFYLNDIRTNYEFYLDAINEDIEQARDSADLLYYASKIRIILEEKCSESFPVRIKKYQMQSV